MRADGLRAALWSTHELRVESRDAVPRLAAWLQNAHGVDILRSVQVLSIDTPAIETTAGRFDADTVIVCPGDDFLGLYAQRIAAYGLTRCALQMMRVMPGAPMRLGAAVLVFVGAYFVEKGRDHPPARVLIQLLAMLPMAVPGLVLGLAYVFFFNAPWNPLEVLYTTILLLSINCVAHFYTVAHITALTALTALKQIDREFESVSQSLKMPFWRTMGRVTVPICMPAIRDIAVYLFVNALTTVSAVVFLYGAQSQLAAISIVHLDEAGATASAAAMATVVFATALRVKLLHLAAGKWVFGRLQAWRRR